VGWGSDGMSCLNCVYEDKVEDCCALLNHEKIYAQYGRDCNEYIEKGNE